MGLFDVFTKPAAPKVAPKAAPVVAPVPAAPVTTPVVASVPPVVPPIVSPVPEQPVPGKPVEPGNLPPDAGVTDPNNPTIPPVTTEPVVAEPVVPELPLDQFKTLWDAVPIDPNAPAPDVPIELKAEDIQKAVANANFTQAITPEQFKDIGEGGEKAQKAFGEAMNLVAQQVMVQATLVGSKITDNAVAKAIEIERAKIPQMLREQATTAHLTDTNPLFDNPAIKPIIETTKAQLLVKHPTATPEQITKMTQDFILAMGEAFAPKTPDLAPGEIDWSKFVE